MLSIPATIRKRVAAFNGEPSDEDRQLAITMVTLLNEHRVFYVLSRVEVIDPCNSSLNSLLKPLAETMAKLRHPGLEQFFGIIRDDIRAFMDKWRDLCSFGRQPDHGPYRKDVEAATYSVNLGQLRERVKMCLARGTGAELLRLTFGIDLLSCDLCGGAMTLVAMVKDPRSIETYLRGIGEPSSPPERSPSRGPPYWKSRVLRRSAD